MSLQYSKYILDKLFVARKEMDGCNLKLICEKRELWAHSSLMGTVSPLVRECSSEAEFPDSAPLEITIPHTENFTCYDCTSKLLDALYAQNVQEIEQGHEAHAENLINFLQIADLVQEFLYDSVASHIPKSKRKYLHLKKTENHARVQEDAATDGNVIKKTLKLKPSNKTISAKMQTCIECGFHCYKPADLLAHVTSTRHGGNVCSLCSYHTESARQFDEHLRKHDNEKPFFCTTCEQRFATRAFWTQHLPVHSSLAPFHCPHCPKAFKWKHGLNGHLITHTKEKKHLCDECGFSTTQAKSLRAHKLTHSGDMFRCSHAGCKHTSARKENMKIHLRTHSKEKPFVCEICGLKFTQNKNLQRHSLIHSQSKAARGHSCLHCSFKALRSDNVKAHVQRQHPEVPLKLDLDEGTVDELSVKEEQGDGGGGVDKRRNDLTVLADAASSRSRIDDIVARQTTSTAESTKSTNFSSISDAVI